MLLLSQILPFPVKKAALHKSRWEKTLLHPLSSSGGRPRQLAAGSSQTSHRSTLRFLSPQYSLQVTRFLLSLLGNSERIHLTDSPYSFTHSSLLPGFRPIHSSGNLQSANSSSPRLFPWPPQPSPSGCPVASLPFLCDLPSCALLLPSLLLLNLSLALPSFWSCLLETDDFQHVLVPATLLCAHLVFPAVHYTSLFGWL